MPAFPSSCAALFDSSDPVPVVLQNYREAAQRAGWEVTTAANNSRVEMSNAEWTVEIEPADEDGLVNLLVQAATRQRPPPPTSNVGQFSWFSIPLAVHAGQLLENQHCASAGRDRIGDFAYLRLQGPQHCASPDLSSGACWSWSQRGGAPGL